MNLPAQAIPSKTPASPTGATDEQATRFSTELRSLAEKYEGKPVQLETLFEATKGRGYNLLLLLIAFPFVTPVPLPGLSIPFGVALAILGTRMALGQKPWLPQKLLRRQLPPRFLKLLVRVTARPVRLLELVLRNRAPAMRDRPIFGRTAGVLIAVSGLFLTLPLPLPFSNSLPAWTVILFAASALGNDGLFFVIGCFSFAVSVAFFTFVLFEGTLAIERFSQFLFHF
jgi:hypothetical protein